MQRQSRKLPKRPVLDEPVHLRAWAVQPGRHAFIIGIGLLLLTGAVIANLPAFEGSAWPRCLYHGLIWIVTTAILLVGARSGRRPDRFAAGGGTGPSTRPGTSPFLKAPRDRATLISLAVVLTFSVAGHYHFGRFHGAGRFLHHHEFYHYYMGSKYFPELGYDGLYAATHRALIENDASFSDTLTLVKNLRTNQLENRTLSTERSATVARLLPEERWQQFKQDVRFFQSKISPQEWQFLLIDHGFNATPFWAFVGSFCASHLALGDRTLYLLAAIDPVLIVAMFLLVGYTFGLKTTLLFAIFFFANFFATFDFTGGAYLRQLWLVFLIGFICFYQRGRAVPAALCLAVAALDRAFPLVFLLLPIVLFVNESWRRRSWRHRHTRFLIAFGLLVVLLGGLSTTAAGASAWGDWFRNIRAHDGWFSINQISLRTLFIVNPVSSASTVHEGGWDEAQWLRERETLDARSHDILRVFRVVLLILLTLLIAKEKEPGVSLSLLSFGPFLLFYPANYYGIVLAVVILHWQKCFGMALAMVVLQAVFWLLGTVLISPLHLEVLHWLVSLSLGLIFGAFLLQGLIRNARGQPRFAGLCGCVILIGALFVGGAVVADRRTGHADAGWAVLDVTSKDVRSVSAATPRLEQMLNWGGGWSRNDHLVFVAAGPGAQATLNVAVGQTGHYQVKIDYSVAPSFGIVSLRVNDRAIGEWANLFYPRVGILPVVYGAVLLTEGANDFEFVVEGKDPASGGYHFAVDRIVLAKIGEAVGRETPVGTMQGRRDALDRAVSWVLSHPADAFDGGRNGTCAEIVALDYLMSRPQLSGNRQIYLDGIRARFDQLGSDTGYRTEPAEYEMLAAAGYIARRLSIDCPAYDRVADQIRRWAASDREGGGARSLIVCLHAHRLNPVAESPCRIDQSALYREYTERTLMGLLSGDVDRTRATEVVIGLHSIAAEVCALTDFGREASAQVEFQGGLAYWGELCERGIRWGRESGDLLLVARLVLVAKCLGVESTVPSFEAAVDFLVQHQESDGCFGASAPYSPNPYRDGVLAAMMAIAAAW